MLRFWSKVKKGPGCWLWQASCVLCGAFGPTEDGDPCVSADQLEETRRRYQDERAELVEALRGLLVWAEWIRSHRKSPAMNEPNTGSIEQARAVLAKVGT